MGKALRARIKQENFSSDLEEAVLNLLIASAHVRERMETICAQRGITHAQYNVLRILKGVYPDGHARCEIARRMLDRAPDVTRLIDRLERAGLAERIRSDEDARLSLSRISRKGLHLLDAIRPELDVMFAELGSRIGTRDRSQLSRICERVYETPPVVPQVRPVPESRRSG